MSDMKEAALAYAAKGWPVFPIDPARKSGKEPYRGSHGVLDATTDPKQITKWWTAHPDANIAMDVGGAQMMVLDLDPGHSIKELEKNVGPLPKTNLRARTPRGGEHLFFDLSDGEYVSPSTSKLAPHVDVRSFNSYVLLAPSKTKDGVYTWEGDGESAYRTDEMVRVAKAAQAKSKDRDKWIIAADMPENIARAVQWLQQKAKIATQGQGGDHCTFATAAYLKSLGISQGHALELMAEHWNDRCEPPWDADDLEQKVENGYRYNAKPPGGYTEAYNQVILKELFAPTKVEGEPGDTVKIGQYTTRDYVAMAHLKAPSWLIQDCIPDDSYAIMFGTHGTYKTFLALDMALSLARGWDGSKGLMWVPERRGAVLFAAGEGLLNLNKRKVGWEQVHNRGEPVKDFVLLNPAPLSIITEEELAAIIKDALRRHPDGYALTVIDTIGRAMTGANENDQADATRFTSLVHRLRQDLGGSVLALHHTGVQETNRLRGSSVFSADADTIIKTEAFPNRIAKLSMIKQKDGASWEDPKHVKLFEKDMKGGQKTLVVTIPTLEEIESARPRVGESENVQEANIPYIIAALHTCSGPWTVKALAIACRDKGCEIPMNSLQTRVLGGRNVGSGDDKRWVDGWARSHPALSKYWRNSPQQWVTPVPLPIIPDVYILDEDED